MNKKNIKISKDRYFVSKDIREADSKDKVPNGGFPPISICEKRIEKKHVQKERFFSTDVKNIRITDILNNSNKKDVLTEENIDIIDVVDSI